MLLDYSHVKYTRLRGKLPSGYRVRYGKQYMPSFLVASKLNFDRLKKRLETPHTVEDLTSHFDTSDDSAETFVQENHIGGSPGCI